MPFQYAPGISSNAASSLQRGNENLGNALAMVFTSLQKQKEQKAQQTEMLKHQDKTADGYINAMLAGVGGDKEKFAQQFGENPDALKLAGAGEKFDWMQGQIKAEGMKEAQAEFATKLQSGVREVKGAQALSDILANAGGDGASVASASGDPTGSGATFSEGTADGKPDYIGALMKAPTATRQAVLNSDVGQKWVNNVMGAQQKTDMQQMRDDSARDRNDQVIAQKDRVLAESNRHREVSEALWSAKNDLLSKQAAAKGELAPKDKLNGLKTIYAAQVAASPFKKDDPEFMKDMADTKAQIDGMLNGSNGKSGNDGTAALPLPADKTKMIKGQTYTTPRGQATWDGTQFQQ